jgi:hypothetical protein
VLYQKCPSCDRAIIYLQQFFPNVSSSPLKSWLVYPPQRSTRPIAIEVEEPYRQDFIEACDVLSLSPRASAALSRSTLQALLRDCAKTKAKDLNDQIEEVIADGKLPTHISESLHAVRNIGNSRRSRQQEQEYGGNRGGGTR